MTAPNDPPGASSPQPDLAEEVQQLTDAGALEGAGEQAPRDDAPVEDSERLRVTADDRPPYEQSAGRADSAGEPR